VKRTVLVWIMVGAFLLGFSQLSRVMAQEATPSSEADQETYVHVVVKGDTLWGICEELYGNPWVWPKVWQLNPHITNPHWIYPGTKLRVYYEIPEGVETATAMTATEQAAPAAKVEPEVSPPPPPPPMLPKVPTLTFTEIDQVGFITPFRPEGDGVILGEERQRKLIGAADRVYLQFQDSVDEKKGDLFFVFNTSEVITHPVTNKEVGYLNRILGIVEVTEAHTEYAKAIVRSSYRAISPGDKLMPYKKRSEEITFEPGAEPIEGNIILSEGDTYIIGDRQIVFIDLGEAEDIKPGNRFEVFQEPQVAGPFEVEARHILSTESIGELLVLAVEQETAAALVVRSLHELVPGERIRLKTGK
jgi:hypothetical protein